MVTSKEQEAAFVSGRPANVSRTQSTKFLFACRKRAVCTLYVQMEYTARGRAAGSKI